ncbi:multidrug efflux pump [Faunimonas pinastri]|uniref:Efflux pump membrane transporter n=1 Tax=Faunimonas pinastri TaxID=1855383 RepID=A0A1H9NGN5_9HYPH|nr:efflux RND transporter permease subunit [Faunimonas pinastri]SER35120.1 multidrug efflux pump [Faunimonas pinastri]
MVRYFLDRPIFAWVIAIVIMLAGALSILRLPIAQYPTIAPPTVRISATYPGASAATVETSVTQVIEQNMKGLDNLQYMSSTSDSSGSVSITLTFSSAADADIAQVQVQNKLQLATSLLPQSVQQQGVTVTKSSSAFLMVAGFVSEDGSMDATDLADYIASNIQDPVSRVEGVGDLRVFGAQYAMRIWLDPMKLEKYGLMPSDITSAVEAQNTQVSAGQLGGTPSTKEQMLNATITAQSRLQTVDQFGGIFLRTASNGSSVYLRDVARIEIGAESYDATAEFNGKPATGLAVNLATGANALDTADAVKTEIQTLSKSFPKGLTVVYPYDTTPFVKLSIEEVVKTLAEAIVLVFLVMYLFLQNLRATLIPTIAVPVVLLGTFGILSAAGFSINTLTMFGMVLAIGLLVDDAIVVVENVERVMGEEGLSPKEATAKSMEEITGALIGIALVLSAVFVPMAFFGGSVGVIYRQFSLTIVSAMALSVIVALIFTPALCATLLKSGSEHMTHRGPLGWFNRGFEATNRGYHSGVGGIIRRPWRFGLLYVILVVVLGFLFVRLPTSFLPEEDQGILMTQIQLPVGSTQQQTLKVIDQVRDYYLNKEKDNVDAVFSVAGFSFGGTGQNVGLAFVKLKDWSVRKQPNQKAQAIAARAMGAFSQIRTAQIFALAPPAVQGLGNSNGFDFYLQDQNGAGHEKLMEVRNQLLGLAAKDPMLAGVRPGGQDDTPQFQVDIDQAKAGALGLSLSDVNATLSTAWAGSYVNDFTDRGRVKKVYVQGDATSRMNPEDLNKWYVRNSSDSMVPLSAIINTKWTYGSPRLERYNGISAVEIQGQAAPGVSSGDAMNEIEKLMGQLPAGFGHEWTGLSYQERLSGSQAPALYAISLLVIFLCLAALYESWSIPFSVMLVVPLGVVGALVAATVFGLSNDVYFQIGLLTTIGLAAKNAILIVEFAKDEQEKGKSVVDAAMEAARLRLRPIVMTSLAFILGVLPLAISTGAGSGSQNDIGIGVIGGMLAATTLGIFYVPLFFVLIRGRLARRRKPTAPPSPPAPPAEPGNNPAHA